MSVKGSVDEMIEILNAASVDAAKHDKGNSALQLAEQLILNELDLVERQQSQENHVRVLTHVGQQSRI